MVRDTTIKANFVPLDSSTITIIIYGRGEVTPVVLNQKFACGSVQTLTATAFPC